MSDSIQFHAQRLEEFPASSEVFMCITDTNKMINIDRVSFTVHPVPAPFSTNELNNSKINDGGNNQNEILFNRGKAMSGAPTNTGKK